MAKPVSETQSINPGSVIEMFELTTDAALHGSATTCLLYTSDAADD